MGTLFSLVLRHCSVVLALAATFCTSGSAAEPNRVRSTGRVTQVLPFDLNIVVVCTKDAAKPGAMLHAYRTHPEPKYLGMITIVETKDSKSLGLFKPSRRSSTIMVDDHADSKILD